ncbi:hypothetical protein BJ165DRAFT_396161 [Panaeolus papilionaceus]|nr:hypothetical protein BJ165DRAFT_396161 [Panaeolus papilionaceus]
MSNYLPVLLVSVTTNAIPDDSALSTLPRGQVDYLSHEWQEEDVWRSWRNMTRQKNEIANGARLENASWRTWWKQRNKLKTISPETLNWLKDSDVTWLYGPLHTAVEWTPPPKPAPVKDDTVSTAGPQDTLDLSSSRGLRGMPYKPILKHRSISQLLTSDLPTSPIFSPHESEEEHEPDNSNQDPSSSSTASQADPSSSKAQNLPSRPKLPHTKSDTSITRYGPSRVFRKNSPPRIGPPGLDSPSQSTSQSPPSSTTSYAPGSIRSSISNDSNSSAGASSVADGEHRSRHNHRHNGQKKKHITFNTFVERCIAIEMPKKSSSGFFNEGEGASWIQPRGAYADEEGYEEDQEDESEEDVYTPHAIWHNQQQHQQNLLLDRRRDSGYPIDEDEDEEDDDVIEIRPSSHRTHPTPKKHRSQSKASTASSSSSASTSTTVSSEASGSTSTSTSTDPTSSPGGSLSPTRPSSKRKSSVSSVSTSSTSTATTKARRTSTSTYRPRGPPPPLLRAPSDHVHVTIAPIAPTLLKTTPVSWAEGFGDESAATDDGMSGWVRWLTGEQEQNGKGKNKQYSTPRTPVPGKGAGSFGTGRGSVRYDGSNGGNEDDDGHASDGTPVELVYVPPLGSNYALGMGEYEDSEAMGYGGVYASGYGHGDGGRPGRGGYGAYGEAYGYPAEDEDDDESEDLPVQDAVGFGNTASDSSDSARSGSSSSSSMRRSGSCSDLPAVGMLGTLGGRSSSRSQNNPTSTPIPIGGTMANGSAVPSVVIDQHRSSRHGEDDGRDASPYGFFGGPDLGEDYFYARRGGRGYERGSGGAYSSMRADDKESMDVYPHGPVVSSNSSVGGTSEMFEYPGPESYTNNTAPVQIASSRTAAVTSPISPTTTVTPSSAQQPSVLRSRSIGIPNARDWERERDKDKDRQRQRQRERANPGNGEERQGRSRSRSQSRTPSPAFMAPVTSGTMGVGSPLKNGIVVGNTSGGATLSASNSSASLGSASSGDASRSSRTGSSVNGELLSPPQGGHIRGRGLHVDTSQHLQRDAYNNSRDKDRGDRDREQPTRGRSSTRGSSASSSWERERASGGVGSSTSPMGSLSPDGNSQSIYSGTTVRGGIASALGKGGAVLASGGRERKPSEEKEDKRGRERRGRDRTSGKMLSVSEDSMGMVLDANPQQKKAESPQAAAPSPPMPPPAPIPGPIPMDVSFSSTTSSSSTSASTIVPERIPAADVDMDEENHNAVSRELRFMRHAEEEVRRRNHPTPSNSPVVEMRMATVVGNHHQTNDDKDDDSSATSVLRRRRPLTIL